MKYTAKDICRITGVTRDTLRYLEKKKIITPEIDPVNGYHYYGIPELTEIISYERKQKLGISANEILVEKNITSLEMFIEATEQIQLRLQKELFEMMKVVDFSQHYLDLLKTIPESVGGLSIQAMPGYCFVPYAYGDEILSDSKSIRENEFMNQHRIYTYPASYVPEISGKDMYLGTAMRSDIAAEFGADVMGFFQIDPGPAIYGILKKELITKGTSDSRKAILETAEKNDVLLRGDILYCQICREKQCDVDYQYVQVFAPVKESQ